MYGVSFPFTGFGVEFIVVEAQGVVSTGVVSVVCVVAFSGDDYLYSVAVDITEEDDVCL